MGDNVTITAGTGTTIAADDIGGVLVQRVKATWGTDGTANDTDTATGKGLPVQCIDGADATLGAKADAAQTDPTQTASLIALIKGMFTGIVLKATSAAGGISSTARMASAGASTNATNVKTSAGRIYSAQGYNVAAYAVYLVLYDSATNPPVPGTTTIRKKIPIPPGAAFALDWALGMSFSSGIGYAFTKLAADADTTALVAGDVLQFNLDYV